MTQWQSRAAGDLAEPRPRAVADLHDVVARQRSPDAAPSAYVSEPSNVVPFWRPRHDSAAGTAPPIGIAPRDRPAPVASIGRRRIGGLLVGSLLVHGAIFFALTREPTPTDSMGEDAISVEIVVGANTAAGVA